MDISPARRIQRGLAKLAAIDPTPLLETLEEVMWEDNRRGVMAGTNMNDVEMKHCEYRLSLASANPSMTPGVGELPTQFTRREGNDFGSSLKTHEYQQLSGPPLAPRGEGSRVISNYRTDNFREGNVWVIEGAWIDILSAKGVPFIHAHFIGLHGSYPGRYASNKGKRYGVNLPRRDLRGLRQWGRNEARNQVNAWAKIQIAESILKPVL